MKWFLVAVSLLLLATCVRLARANVPRTIPFQGIVTSPSEARIDGARSVTFTLYGTSGVSRWTETKGLVITRGVLTTMLGDSTTFPPGFPFDQAYHLGITVGGDPEMTPCTERRWSCGSKTSSAKWSSRSKRSSTSKPRRKRAMVLGQERGRLVV